MNATAETPVITVGEIWRTHHEVDPAAKCGGFIRIERVPRRGLVEAGCDECAYATGIRRELLEQPEAAPSERPDRWWDR